MLAEFTVKNFLSIRKQVTLDFVATKDDKNEQDNVMSMKDGMRILKSSIIYGMNATGKSNLVRAIAYFRELVTLAPSDKDVELYHIPFAFDNAYKQMASSMSVTFYIDGIKYYMSVEFIGNRILDEVLSVYLSNRPTCLYHRTVDRKGKVEVNFNTKSGLTKASWGNVISNTLSNGTVLAAFGKSNVETCHLTKVYNYFVNTFSGVFTSVESLADFAKDVISKDKSGHALEFIQEMFSQIKYDVEISLHKTLKGSELNFKYNRNGYELTIPERFEGKGIIRFLGLSALLYCQLNSPSLVILDALDNELHPFLRAFFFQTFLENCKNTSQTIFTTHSFYLLDREFIRHDTVWFSYLRANHSTKLKRLSKMGVKKYANLRNAYYRGDLVSHKKLGKLDIKQLLFDFDITDENEEIW